MAATAPREHEVELQNAAPQKVQHAPQKGSQILPPPLATLECAICFEPIEHKTDMPCACKIDYCRHCWDRALAHSINACGRAQCPSCRCPVRVDFDAESGSLLFSRVEESSIDPAADPEVAYRSARDRLIEQARPAQVRILQQYGVAHPLSPLTRTLGIDEVTLAVRCEQTRLELGLAAPNCVCGGFLERVSRRERAGRICQWQVPQCPPRGSFEFERVVDLILARLGSPASCDLCGEPIESAVWTCENGDDTILHTNAYDVCDGCFIRYCYDIDLPRREAPALPSGEEVGAGGLPPPPAVPILVYSSSGPSRSSRSKKCLQHLCSCPLLLCHCLFWCPRALYRALCARP